MIASLLFIVFLSMMMAGVPIGAALGLAGAACIALANADSQWFGLLAVPQNFYAGLGKYPLLAIPMFVLVGSIFDRSGVAARLVNFAVAIVGRGPRHAAAGGHWRGHVHGRHLRLGPGHRRSGGWGDDCRHAPRRVPRRFLRQRGGWRSGDRYFDSALGGFYLCIRCWCPALRCPRCLRRACFLGCWPGWR